MSNQADVLNFVFLNGRTSVFPKFSSIRGAVSLHRWRDKVCCWNFLPLSRGLGKTEGVMQFCKLQTQFLHVRITVQGDDGYKELTTSFSKL